MKKKILLLFISFSCSVAVIAQDFTTLWEGHFSYLNIKDVVQGNGKIYAASENALFSYDLETLQLENISSVNGLSGEFISTIYYSENTNQLVIGYVNGLIEIIQESTDEVITVVDIVDKQTIPPNDKRINHFNAYDGKVYIATDFGISVYNLSRLEFEDTYFIGDGGGQIQVSQTAIFEDYIYAACEGNSGIRRALISSSNLIDFQEWTQIASGSYLGIEKFGDKLYGTSTNNNIYEINDSNLIQLYNYTNEPLDLKSSNNYLIVTTRDEVFVYDHNFNLLASPNVIPEFDTEFTAAIAIDEGIFIGTETFGVLQTTINDTDEFQEIHPEGPLKNNTFSIQSGFGGVWATYGDYNEYYNPNPIKRHGISRFYDGAWTNIPYDSLLESTSLNTISINPFNPDQVFISSFHRGLLELNNNEPIKRHDQTNSGLESLILTSAPSYVSIRVSGTLFDNNGLLWSITSLIEKPLKSYDPNSNQWRSYDFTDLILNPISDNLGFEELVLHPSGTKFIASFSLGVIGFNENGGNQLLKNISEENENLPANSVRALALDKRNQLWIGTDKGLRVLYNTSNFFTDDNVTTSAIIILEDGIPKELLDQQFISDIKVDGSNNKWVGTIGAGLFYFSSDGQQTIFHFTKDNSPLPSNNINDVSIDEEKGIVYIATDRGLLSFKSGGSAPLDGLTDAYIYPNPVRPTFNAISDKIKIKDISDNVNIKIVDIAGNLVAEAQSRTNLRYRGFNLEIDGGTAYWNGKNLANNSVASGVYLVMLSDLDTFETKVLKLMIVR